MRTFLIGLTLTLAGANAPAQNPGIQAAQQAAQISTQITQQANAQAVSNAQLASQNATVAQQHAMNAQMSRCGAPTPSFSVKSGKYSSVVTVTISASGRTAVYYTTDGWTPTKESARYTGPITIDSTTTLQAIAVSPCDVRSRLASAVYTLTGVTATPTAGQNVTVLPGLVPTISSAAAAAAPSGKALLAQGTAVPLVFASNVNSKTAHVGDKITLTLAQDLKAGDAVVATKGASSIATITEVRKPRVMGWPGEVVFRAGDLQADGTVIKLHGSAAKEGPDKSAAATALMTIPAPVGLLVRGKDAEIKRGAVFTAFVDTDTLIPAK